MECLLYNRALSSAESLGLVADMPRSCIYSFCCNGAFCAFIEDQPATETVPPSQTLKLLSRLQAYFALQSDSSAPSVST